MASSSSSSSSFVSPFFRPLFARSLLILIILFRLSRALPQSQCKLPPIIFNFGDSNSDTGGLVAGLGYVLNAPYGRTFFRRSTGRLSDGRLVIDFLCQSVNTSFLNPYLESLGSSFSNGANFAVVGSTTLPRSEPFALNIQVKQFLRFKARSLELANAGSQNQISDEGFRNALYMIDIGQNDLADSFSMNLSYSDVIKKVPSIIREIKMAMKHIYDAGGRKFWIHNTGPLGCLPQKLSTSPGTPNVLDQHQCLSDHNTAASMFNEELRALCQVMRTILNDTTIVYVDIYSIKYDLIVNFSSYGFSNSLMACCGFGGPPNNYNKNVTCGEADSNVCSEDFKSISWDGIHYTEAANSIVASKVQSTLYSTPRLAFDFFCH